MPDKIYAWHLKMFPGTHRDWSERCEDVSCGVMEADSAEYTRSDLLPPRYREYVDHAGITWRIMHVWHHELSALGPDGRMFVIDPQDVVGFSWDHFDSDGFPVPEGGEE